MEGGGGGDIYKLLKQDLRSVFGVGFFFLFCNFRYPHKTCHSKKSLDHITNKGSHLFSNSNYVSKALWMHRHRRARKRNMFCRCEAELFPEAVSALQLM